jgi:hypothetical protein
VKQIAEVLLAAEQLQRQVEHLRPQAEQLQRLADDDVPELNSLPITAKQWEFLHATRGSAGAG